MTFNSIFTKKYDNWDAIEKDIENLETTKEKGDAFEQFAFAYFIFFKNLYQIKEIYMWPDIPANLKEQFKLEKKDNGVDGLFIRDDGSSVAYQVKFRKNHEVPGYHDLTSFWAESEYTDERCIFANSYTLPEQTDKKKNQFLVLRDSLTSLPSEFFEWFYALANNTVREESVVKFSPLAHQKKMISDVINGFQTSDRGKMLAACGTGKTLTALWIKEQLNARLTLFVTPNLALIKQTLEAWMPQAAMPFSYLCVCSDLTVAAKADSENFNADISSIGVPVTTDSEKIYEFITHPSQKDKVIFSTYQSLDAIVSAVRELDDITFDIAFFDEAHRTAGNKDSVMFTLGMDNKYIPCEKRLFMTATEKVVNPHIADLAKQFNYDVFSMDDEEQYGKTFTALPFRDAIEQGIISDYKIVLCCMKESELKTIIRNNRIIDVDNRQVDAQTLFKQTLLAKTMAGIGINKVISYHRDIESAQTFIKPGDGFSMNEIASAISGDIAPTDVYCDHINGSMKAGERKEIFENFIKAPYGVISNARCLTEGVDVPIIDAVYFSDPKNSIIDIIQAVGRSLRKDKNKPDKVSYIVIPLIIPDSVTKFEDIDPQEFSTLLFVIQALRDQDRILTEYINTLNLEYAKGSGHITTSPNNPIVVVMSEEYNIADFSDNLYLRIAEIKTDQSINNNESDGNRASRASGVARTFRTIGDYNIVTFYENLVEPTLKKFQNRSIGLSRNDLRIDNNNVSHCERIGAIYEEDQLFYVSDVGKALLDHPDKYVDIFKEQMLKYYDPDSITPKPMFPYRMAMSVLAELEYITRFELAYSLYIGKNVGKEGVDEAIKIVNYLRDTYANIEFLNDTNKRIELEALNLKFNTTLSYDDIWTTRTTVYNQYNYLKKHLLIWDDIFDAESKKSEIKLLPGGDEKIVALLEKSAEIEQLAENEQCTHDMLKKLFIEYKGY
ncbi:MAG: DEAD/DEAH box helicase family protein [Thermoguttaceae bacterium]|nr:DEAD/DEAH box helicase family protein [Thermoguttaceae bacterium]